MRRSASTMTRAELLGNARIFGIAAAVSAAIVVGASALMGDRLGGGVAVLFVGGFVFLGAALAALWFGIWGLLRAADWSPGPERFARIDGFDGERESKRLKKRVRKELAEARVGKAYVDEIAPRVPTSPEGWRAFVASTDPVIPLRQVTVAFELDGRGCETSVRFGRTLDDANARLIEIELCAQTTAAAGPDAPWCGDPEVLARLAALTRTHSQVYRVATPNAGLDVTDGIATLVTLPSNDLLAPHFGLAEFIALVDAIEAQAA